MITVHGAARGVQRPGAGAGRKALRQVAPSPLAAVVPRGAGDQPQDRPPRLQGPVADPARLWGM